MIKVDTDLLRQLTHMVESANQEISRAVDCLNQVVTHDNWGCPERKQINEFTRQNKNKLRYIQEAEENFCRAIISVCNDFELLEKQFPSIFSSMDGVLGEVLSIPLQYGSGFASTGTIDIIQKILSKISGNETEAGGSLNWKKVMMDLTKGIKVVDFNSLTF